MDFELYTRVKKEISDRIKGRSGEPIIFEIQKQGSSSSNLSFVGGFLESDEVKYDNKLVIPTGDYIHQGYYFTGGEILETKVKRVGDSVCVFKGPLNFNTFNLEHWNSRSYFDYSLMAVGLDEVRFALLKSRYEFLDYLENPSSLQTHLDDIRNPYDERLALMYRLLKKEVPEVIQAEEIKFYERKKIEILDSLELDIGQALMIQKRMKEITTEARSVEEVRKEVLGSTRPFVPINYDTDDAIVMNLGNNEELKRARFRIIRNLEEALDLGLEKDETPVTNGFPGRYIMPSEFIRNLCAQFDVK